jgi:hypothetical protein
MNQQKLWTTDELELLRDQCLDYIQAAAVAIPDPWADYTGRVHLTPLATERILAVEQED